VAGFLYWKGQNMNQDEAAAVLRDLIGRIRALDAENAEIARQLREVPGSKNRIVQRESNQANYALHNLTTTAVLGLL
jgi:hypothetical protein